MNLIYIIRYVLGSQTPYVGDKLVPPLIGNPYTWTYIHPWGWWVYPYHRKTPGIRPPKTEASKRIRRGGEGIPGICPSGGFPWESKGPTKDTWHLSHDVFDVAAALAVLFSLSDLFLPLLFQLLAFPVLLIPRVPFSPKGNVFPSMLFPQQIADVEMDSTCKFLVQSGDFPLQSM